ncbi:MAG: hypothetical protein NTX33_17485 [Propionibacteriales bacterium]|nr:hypothetical protein [Propionibacteriales bacterium]
MDTAGPGPIAIVLWAVGLGWFPAMLLWDMVSKSKAKARDAHARVEADIQTMRRLNDESLAYLERLPELAVWTKGWLEQAQRDQADRAFAPFWDAIQGAAENIGAAVVSVQSIERNGQQYGLLATQYPAESPFAVAGITPGHLSVFRESSTRLDALVRSAQRDFQFATIYEQRKTTQVLIAGFNNLGQAIANMSSQVTSAIGSLDQTVNRMSHSLQTNLNTIASEASVRHREAMAHEQRAFAALDNLQRGRKPLV